jgi:hypothetical protein
MNQFIYTSTPQVLRLKMWTMLNLIGGLWCTGCLKPSGVPAGIRREILAISTGPNWVCSTSRRRQNPVSETSPIMSRIGGNSFKEFSPQNQFPRLAVAHFGITYRDSSVSNAQDYLTSALSSEPTEQSCNCFLHGELARLCIVSNFSVSDGTNILIFVTPSRNVIGTSV